jgi:hypothetical protein
MSTKSSKLYISETGEHWYEELSYGDEGLVLTFDSSHLIETDIDGTCITIKQDTPLYKAFYEMLEERYRQGKNHGIQEYLRKHKA